MIEFTGDSTSYAGDIAILWISEKITFSRGVAPACVDWTDTSRFVPPDNAKGKVSEAIFNTVKPVSGLHLN